MKQKSIDIKDIEELGFLKKQYHDAVFYEKHGALRLIAKKKLAHDIYIEWDGETGFCSKVILPGYSSMTRTKIISLKKLKKIIKKYENMTTLLPCPFCGSVALDYMDSDGYSVVCSEDGCYLSEDSLRQFKTKEEAIRKWNKRK